MRRIGATGGLLLLLLNACAPTTYKIINKEAIYSGRQCAVIKLDVLPQDGWKADPLVRIQLHCESSSSVDLIETRYEENFSITRHVTASKARIDIRYCRYKNFDSFYLVQKRVRIANELMKKQGFDDFEISTSEIPPPCRGEVAAEKRLKSGNWNK